MKVSAFVAVTADGCIADHRTIDQWHAQTDYGFQAFYQTVDRLIVGRQTYQRQLNARLWPYGEKPIVVLSRSYVEVPATLARLVEASRQAPQAILAQMMSNQVGHVYIDGGLAVRSVLTAGLISELTLTRLPILTGQGQPIFGTDDNSVVAPQRLEHQHSEAYPDGVIQTRYRVLQQTL